MNRTVVITGAGGVLCSAFAEFFAEKGDKVALIDLNLEAAQGFADKLVEKGYKAKAYKGNVLEKDLLEEVHKEILSDFGKCDVLINGAGGNSPRCTTLHETFEIEDLDATDYMTFFNLEKPNFQFVFDLNIMGTLIPTQIFAKDMIGREDCCILNVSSMNAYRPLTKIPAYSAAKAAVTNLTQWLAVHFAEQGIRVNAIAPGFFVTKQNEALLFNQDGTPTARTNKILAATPMKRFGKPEELIGAVEWLTDSKKAGFVTGITLAIDGGFSSYSGV